MEQGFLPWPGSQGRYNSSIVSCLKILKAQCMVHAYFVRGFTFFFPGASEGRVILTVGFCYPPSPLPIFTSTSSHLHISTHITFSSSHLHIYSTHIIFTSRHLNISSSHLRILYLHISSSHLHIFISSYLNIFTSSHPTSTRIVFKF